MNALYALGSTKDISPPTHLLDHQWMILAVVDYTFLSFYIKCIRVSIFLPHRLMIEQGGE